MESGRFIESNAARFRRRRFLGFGIWASALVLLLAQASLHARADASAQNTSCPTAQSMRVGAVHFPLAQPRQLDSEGAYGFEQGVPNEVLQRLAFDPGVQVRRAEVRLLFEPRLGHPDPRRQEVKSRVRALSRQWNVDYLLAGVLVDIGWKPGWVRSLNQRQAEIEIFVFAGDSGEVILQQRAGGVAIGNVLHNRRIEFGSQAFFLSDYGRVFDTVINELVASIRTHVFCPPEPT
jgi:hypothetical protein